MEYKHMMGQGEDSEEFALRVSRAAQAINPAIGYTLIDDLQTARTTYFERYSTRRQFARDIEAVIKGALAVTGPVEPSIEYVGYF